MNTTETLAEINRLERIRRRLMAAQWFFAGVAFCSGVLALCAWMGWIK